MAKVRLREPRANSANGHDAATASPLAPLRVSGIVVHKTALLEALRVYVPALVDVRVTEDGEHFWLMLGEAGGEMPDGGH